MSGEASGRRYFAGFAGSVALTGTLNGRTIEFAFPNGAAQTRFTGTVDGNRISGTVLRDGTSTEYVGTRSELP